MAMRSLWNALVALDTNLPVTAWRYLCYRLRGKRIVAHTRAKLHGVQRIITHGNLYVGTQKVGFSHPGERTFLNVRGKLTVHSSFLIGRGCRVDIGPGAVCELGSGYLNVNSKLVVTHFLRIGHGVSIGWDCELLDDDFHQLSWEGRAEKEPGIVLGDHVWIGSGVKILKGVRIGAHNVIAAGAVVTKSFIGERQLIAGNPARVIKNGVSWR